MHVSFESVEKGSNIIDVRSNLDYDKKHLKGSINIPRLNLLKNHETYLNKNDIYYIICDKGEVSLSCSRILNALGYNCYSIDGGMEGINNK